MKNLSLSTKILLGVLLGVFLGLFFGEEAGWFSIPGSIFIGLLQMMVLPYIMFLLIVNIGRLSMETGKETFQLFIVSTVLTDKIRITLGASQPVYDQ